MFNEQSQETPEQKQQEGTATPQPTSSSSPFDTMLQGIKNERGEPKYRSVEDGLNALKHSQEHITKLTAERSQLEQELATLRSKVTEIDTLKEVVEKLTQRQQESAPQSQFDEEKVANLVDTRLTLRQQQEAAIANQQAVARTLQEKYGEKARDTFYQKGSELGYSPEEFEALAASKPKAVLTMLGIVGEATQKSAPNSPVQSKVNTEHFQGQPSSFIGAESERIPLGGGETHYNRILENSRNMVAELRERGMSVDDLTNPANYFKFIKGNK